MPRKPKRPALSKAELRGRQALERLAEEGLAPENIKELLKKDQTFTFRLSRFDKEGIQDAAKACDMTATEYLLKLHGMAVRSLKESELL